MTVKGAFTVELSGPYEARAALLEALAKESIAARYISPQAAGLDEEAKGWVSVEFHDGTESPHVEFQRACLNKTRDLGQQFSYQVRSYGVVTAAAAQLKHVVDKRTNSLVVKAFNLTDDDLPAFAERIGIPADFLELRDPPGLWDVPDA